MARCKCSVVKDEERAVGDDLSDATMVVYLFQASGAKILENAHPSRRPSSSSSRPLSSECGGRKGSQSSGDGKNEWMVVDGLLPLGVW